MNKLQTVTIKAITDESVIVAGYGVVFGGVDLDGETFGPDTDYMLDLVPQKPVLYDHGMNETVQKSIIGMVGKAAPDDTGLWVEAELERHSAYMDAILELIEKGALGWSSGTVGQLALRDGKSIKRWPVVEFSLTPTPAEPRTLGVEQLKALTDMMPALGQLSTAATAADDIAATEPTEVEQESAPEDARTASDALAKADDGSTTDNRKATDTGDPIMSEEKQVAEQVEATDNSAELAAILEAVKGVGAKVESVETANADQIKAMADRIEAIESQPAHVPAVQTDTPAVVKSLGDNEVNAFAAWYKTGDVGGVKHMVSGDNQITVKASNATDMNIGTDADGGYAVPTGHYQGIIARMHEGSLYQQLGVMQIPGRGTTVNVPIDNEADGEFVSTAEANTFDLDAPAIDQVAMTLVKYTKNIKLSYELLDDEDSRLLAFVEQWVGSGLARTHNSLMLTEALADGTAGLTLDGAAAVTAAEVPELMYKLKGEYADQAAWVMARASEGYLRGLTGDNFQFVPTPQGTNAGSQVNTTGRELFGAPVYNSAYMPAIGGGNKSLLFGNFSKMGVRIDPDITFLRNPYLLANTGQISLHYYTRIDYEVLQAEAIQYATHPTA
jgi:HK97 family phage major capsid protein